MRRGRRWFWLLAFVLFTVGGVLYFEYRVFEDRAGGVMGSLPRRLADELGGAYTALALMPAVAWLARRHPLVRGRLATSLPAHLGGLAAYSAVHTFLLAILHGAVYPLVGLAADSYLPHLGARALQELAHDVLAYGLFVALVAAWDAGEAWREIELRTLRLQLQPHFLFNALNTVSETLHEDPAAADAMLGHLAELLRLSLRTAPTAEVPLAEELVALRRYTALLEARFGDRLRVVVDVPDDAAAVLVPSLLLQPIVENVVRHAETGQPLTVTVRARRVGAELHIAVEDDGPGADPGADVLGQGLGLASTAARLRLLHRGRAALAAGNRPEGGFAVRLRLPGRT